jgi:hypothetical protein
MAQASADDGLTLYVTLDGDEAGAPALGLAFEEVDPGGDDRTFVVVGEGDDETVTVPAGDALLGYLLERRRRGHRTDVHGSGRE